MRAFYGYTIIEDINMLMDGKPEKVERKWKERLFSSPWNPFKKHKIVIPKIPSDKVIANNSSLVMHPETAKMLRETTWK